MTISLAFDVYGTMIGTSGVVTALERIIGAISYISYAISLTISTISHFTRYFQRAI